MKTSFRVLSALTLLLLPFASAKAGIVEIKNDQLHIDSQPQPQLFGAEIQYFRMRGGHGPNLPREKVIEIWTKALDAAVEAKMNAVSFYIPWDFHEYANGKFDFDGTADEDGDGRADFPSRDVKTFIRMITARGIKHIMARPGPNINAEWGFSGFGAVPPWLHDQFPDSHMMNPQGLNTTLFSYHSPELLRFTQRWIENVHAQVLAPYIGPHRPISFIQLDNETNYGWQSLYNHDFSPRSVAKYREFLQTKYGSIEKLNSAHQKAWRDWQEIWPPTKPSDPIGERQDWYRFEDKSIHVYLMQIRKAWEHIGVKEPQVLFTLAESYNAPANGMLPHYEYRNDPGKTGMMTVNLYPKTNETPDLPLMNTPFKADHDVKAADAASDHYLRRSAEFVMAPEVQGGWWRDVNVSLASRQQTYLSTIGHGVKAMFIYYFNEGENWESDWSAKRLRASREKLHSDDRYKDFPQANLPETFWHELNQIVFRELFVGWDARWLINNQGPQGKDLRFDASIGPDGEKRPPFALAKKIGEKIIAPYGDFLGGATELTDDVCLIKDSDAHAPSAVAGLDSIAINADGAAGLVGLLLQAGINPKIHVLGLSHQPELKNCRLTIYQDNGFASDSFVARMKNRLQNGAGVLSFLSDGLVNRLKSNERGALKCDRLTAKSFEIEGESCRIGPGRLYHVRTPIYEVFNSSNYAKTDDAPARRDVITTMLRELGIKPKLKINGGGDRVVAFARKSRDEKRLWVTVKSGRLDSHQNTIQWSGADRKRSYRITDVFAERSFVIKGSEIIQNGFPFALPPHGSAVFDVNEVSSTDEQ